MRVDVNMTVDETKFSVASWWASSPDFVLGALSRQLAAAKVVWPALEKYHIGTIDHQSAAASSAESSEAEARS